MKEIPHLQEAFAQVLQEARAQARLSQQALANEVECARSFISFMETREHLPSLNGFLVLSRALGIPSTELLKRVEIKLTQLEDIARGDTLPEKLEEKPLTTAIKHKKENI